VVIRVGLDHLPPLFFAALRFTFVFFPLALFLKRPAPWRNLAAYGLLIGAGQFGLLFIAMDGRISPGLASLVLQTQVFFTIGLSIVLSGERLKPVQWLALALAVAGIVVILVHTDAHTTPLGLAIALLAALCWGVGNHTAKQAGRVNMLAYVAWSSLFALPPLFALAFMVDGWPAIRDGVMRADLATWAAVAFQSVANSMFGYAVWGWLLARHLAATITPMALLVPVFGMAASLVWLGEPLPFWKIAAALLVMTGLAVNVLAPRLRRR
jgi:O-acetylserine/cysteine efflux transporter